MSFRSLIAAGVAALFLASGPTAAEPNYIARGVDHYFNLEYDEAVVAYRQAIEAEGESATVWNYTATSLLYSELHRLGKLETSAFKGDNPFLDEEKPQPDPEANQRFLDALMRSRELAEERIEQDPGDLMALFSLSQNHGLEANYLFMIEKSYLSALRAGGRARKLSNQLRKLDPNFTDALLVAGVQEYVVGSLPWAVKVLVAIGGVRGNKKKGQAWVAQVASEGRYLRTEAKVLMTLLHRRENRPLEAAVLLRELIENYPRNYVLKLELGSMYLDADERDKALDVFEDAQRMVQADEQNYGRMPRRLRMALERKIESLREPDNVAMAR